MEDGQLWKEQKRKTIHGSLNHILVGKEDDYCYSQEMLREGLKRLFRDVQSKLLLLDSLKCE